MKILFNVENQKLKRIDNNSVVADSKNYLKAKFNFLSDDWNGQKTAIFQYGKEKPLYKILDENNECEVPWEFIKPPCFTVSIFAGDLITTNDIAVAVKKSGYKAGANAPKIPTPDIYTQIINMLQMLAAPTQNNKCITMHEINKNYADIKNKILAFAYGFIFTDGTDTSKLCNVFEESGVVYTIDSVALYGGVNGDKRYTDYIYYNAADEVFKVVKQTNTVQYTQLGYTEESIVSISENLIEKILLPLGLDDVLKLIAGKKISTQHLSYTDCGAYLDGVHDDRPFIECCHRIANTYNLKVEQHQGTIYIANSGYITVSGDMSLKGSTLLIDNYNRQGIYWLSATKWGAPSGIDYKELTKECSYCSAMNAGYPNYSLLKIIHPNDCIRIDDGTTTSISREELLLMTYKGNIIYPPIQDATQKTTYEIYIYPGHKTVIEGCVLDISVTFAGSPIYFISSEKSNVEIRDFYILPKSSTVKNTKYRGALFAIKNSFNVTFDNIIGYNIAGEPSATLPNGMSGYIFKVDSSLCVTIRNCNATGYWGCMGMNGVKNVIVEDSTLNRIDIHDYFKDLKINNCVILNNGVQVGFGHGSILISNSTLYTDKSYFVELRTDYGNMFDGVISLSNNHIIYTGNGEFNIVDNSVNFVNEALTLNENTNLQKPCIAISGVTLEPPIDYNLLNFEENENILYKENESILKVEI